MTRTYNSWSMDYEGLPAVDLFIPANPTPPSRRAAEPSPNQAKSTSCPRASAEADAAPDSEMAAADVANVLRTPSATAPPPHPTSRAACAASSAVPPSARLLRRLRRRRRRRRRPRHLGQRGAGVEGHGRLPIAVCGDGDFLMGNTAFWLRFTAFDPVPGAAQSLVSPTRSVGSVSPLPAIVRSTKWIGQHRRPGHRAWHGRTPTGRRGFRPMPHSPTS